MTASDDYSAIDPPAMDDFEQALGWAEATLGRSEPHIHRALQKLGLDTSGLGALREAHGWIKTSRPDLRRRNETIRKEQTEWGTSSGDPIRWALFDEALYAKAAHDPDVYAAIPKLTEAAEKGEVDAKTLAELEKRTGNATFAVGLMNAMGAKRFRELMATAVEQGEDKEAKRLQAVLGKTLATASSKLSDAWRDELTSRPALGWPGQEYRAVALALQYGTFASPFLLGVAKKLDAWDRESVPAGIDSNVMIPLLEALGNNPAAAQDFFASDSTSLKYFLVDWDMSDGGKALGKALEAATLKFRDHDGSPQNPSRGYLSAKLASEFVHIEAERLKSSDHPESFVTPVTTGRILAGYISDIDRVAQTGDDAPVPSAQDNDNPSGPGKDPWGAQFNEKELRRVMKDAFTDSTAFTPVLAAQRAFTDWLFDHSAAEMAAGKGSDALLFNAQRIGAGFAMITDAANIANIDKGAELDKTQQQNMKLLTATVNTALAIPQTGGWPIVAGLVGAWTGKIEDSVKGDAEATAQEDANSAVNQTRSLVHNLTVRAMLKHGLFGSSKPVAETHPWASLKDLKKGDDPRLNPNNFLKDDGRTLIMADDMTDKDRQMRAYKRWLYGGPSGEIWQKVSLPLNQSFSDAFSKYGT